MSAWFAVRVRPKHERTAAYGLERLGFEQYVPLHRVRRRWSDRIKEVEAALFPGYIFARFAGCERLRVLSCPGVESIVRCGKTDIPVDEAELAAVRVLVASGRPLLLWPRLRIGQLVGINNGPLSGLRGVIVRDAENWRVVVNVEALDRSVAVEVDRNMIAPWQ
ncbi:MAG: transcriptional activator RfaH [Bryobacterales bacterium]|nr:transcriptional activator RfaH [Bryobacterales bacterium]